MVGPLHRERDRVTPALVFFSAFAVFLFGLAPDVYWLDSSELAAAAFGLGVAHPPGHPLAVLAGKACALIPVGTVAFRVGLASALAGAAAAMQTARLAREIALRVGAPARAADFLCVAASLTFALTPAAVISSVRPEVYALSTLLVVSCALELLRFDASGDRRRALLAALWGGLALANHHLLALTLLVPGAVFLLWKRGPVARALAIAASVAFLSYAYLPLRAATHPLVNWGAPTTLSRVWWVVSARAFQKAVERGSTSDAGGALGAIASQLHVIGLLLALAGAYVLVRMRELRALGALLLCAAVLDGATVALVGFDVANPDAYGYLMAAAALGCALLVALPAVIASHVRPLAALAMALVLGAGGVAWGAVNFEGLTRHWETSRPIAAWLDRAPPRGQVVTSYYQTVFALWYLRSVEGLRPDAALVHRHFLSYPGYREELQHHGVAADAEPDLVEFDLDLPSELVPDSSTIPVGEVSELQSRRFAAWQEFLARHRDCRLGRAAEDECAKLRSSIDR